MARKTPGRKPKPDALRVNRAKRAHEFTVVEDRPFPDPPPMPAHPTEGWDPALVPEPPRYLMAFEDGRPGPGLATWRALWPAMATAADVELLVTTCELQDERVVLKAQRRQVLDTDPAGAWRLSVSMRDVEKQIAANLRVLGAGDPHAASRPGGWTPEAVAWWEAASTMPHCALWGPAEWEYARETLLVAQAFYLGKTTDKQLRSRMDEMGWTAAARMNLRIRYAPPSELDALAEAPEDDVEASSEVASLQAKRDARRARLTGT